MKYNLLNKDLDICWPKLYDDDIDWFRRKNDILEKNDRDLIEEIYSETKKSNDTNFIFKNIDRIYNVIKKYKHITKITKNVINNFKTLITTELKLINLSRVKNNYSIQ